MNPVQAPPDLFEDALHSMRQVVLQLRKQLGGPGWLAAAELRSLCERIGEVREGLLLLRRELEALGSATPALNLDRTLLSFHLGEVRAAVALREVVEVVRLVAWLPLDGFPPAVLGLINLRGQALPVLRPAVLLDHPARPPDPDQFILVVEQEDCRTGLLVDSVDGLFEADPARFTPREQLRPEAGGRSCVLGALDDPGGMLLVLDLEGILDQDAAARLRVTLESGGAPR